MPMLDILRKFRPEPSIFDEIMNSNCPMPAAEFAWVEEEYAKASTILEYGSGRTTIMASDLPGVRLFSVESDASWSARLQEWLAAEERKGTVHLHYADIGKTRDWGNPKTDASWATYHRYPLSVWDRPDFVHPDVILIDGRFRAACWMTAFLRITKPTTVLFDDYGDRPHYHVVERYAKPVETRGRMVRFDLEPQTFPVADLTGILEMYTKVD